MEIFNELSNEGLKKYFTALKISRPLEFVKIGMSVYANENLFYGRYGNTIDSFIDQISGMNENEILKAIDKLINPDGSLENGVENIDEAVLFFEEYITDDYLNAYSIWFNVEFSKIYKKNFAYGNYDGIYETLLKNDKVKILSSVSDKIKEEDHTIYTEEFLDNIWCELSPENKKKSLKTFISEINY